MDCSIWLKFGTASYHVSADTLQMFKVKRSKVKVTRKCPPKILYHTQQWLEVSK